MVAAIGAVAVMVGAVDLARTCGEGNDSLDENRGWLAVGGLAGSGGVDMTEGAYLKSRKRAAPAGILVGISIRRDHRLG